MLVEKCCIEKYVSSLKFGCETQSHSFRKNKIKLTENTVCNYFFILVVLNLK